MPEAIIPFRQGLRLTNTPPTADELLDGQIGIIRTATVLRMFIGGPAGVNPREFGGGNGTVLQVGLALPTNVFDVGGPVTTSGNLSGTFKSQAINLIFASPTDAPGTPVFRALVIDDFGALPRLDQWADPTDAIDVNGQRLLNVSDPAGLTDVSNWGYIKSYIDETAAGRSWKDPVVAATTANISLTGSQTVDGVSVGNSNERVLVKNQADLADNGIYDSGSGGAWSRTTDADTWDELIAATVVVSGGTVNADKTFTCSIEAGGTLEVTALPWVDIGSVGAVEAGDGLIKSGQIFSVDGTPNRIVVGPSGVDIDPNYAGQVSITILGTISQGTWEADAIDVAYGGTGATTAAGARTNLGLELGSDVQAWSIKLQDIADTAFNDNELLMALGGRIVPVTSIYGGDF